MSRPSEVQPYLDKFDQRAARYTAQRVRLYNQANQQAPLARAIERELLIQALRLKPGIRLCDVVAGGGYLAEGVYQALDGDCEIVCVENSVAFARSIDSRFQSVVSPLGAIDLPDASLDRVACLAGLHHQERKIDFFREAFRILKPRGRLVVADALGGSPPARFLNGPVDAWSDLGHDGLFLGHGELTTLAREAGFCEVVERYQTFTWNFPSRPEMVSFCRTLFRMTKATLAQVASEIDRHLRVHAREDGVGMEWSLIYASAIEPAA